MDDARRERIAREMTDRAQIAALGVSPRRPMLREVRPLPPAEDHWAD